MEDFNFYLNQRFLENRVENILYFAGVILLGFLFKRFASIYISKLFYAAIKNVSDNMPVQQFLNLLKRPVEVLITLIFLYTAFSFLIFPKSWDLRPINEFGLKMFLIRSYRIAIILSSTWIILRIIDFFGLVYIKRAELTESKLDDQMVPFFKEMAKIFTVIFTFFFILGAVFKLNIASLVAGLGIGGLAVALAGKETLENLFASFTIFLDKPFVVGDLVQVGTITGTVEKVGFRSTRIRTLEKTFLTLPNKQMVDQPLDNLTLRTFRRARYNFSLKYNTPVETIKLITKDIQDFIDNHPRTNQDGQVRFLEFAASSLEITVLYFVDTMDFVEYNNVRQEINYEIIRVVKKHNAEFALPSTSLYFEKDKRFAQIENSELADKNDLL